MALLKLGPIIKYRREELGLSQEDLADGICSVPTLSRIENGERMPTRNHAEMLMQRLGYSAMSIDYFTDRRDFELHEAKIQLRYAYIAGEYALAERYYNRFKHLLNKPTTIDQQFLSLYHILLHQRNIPANEKLTQLENTLKLSCPRYAIGHIPGVLSYEEIILLNNIAICSSIAGNTDRAISILYTLKEYYEHNIVSTDEALRTQPMILYNLSKYLGLQSRYDECIEICDIGIRIARKTGRCILLAETMYNRAWALNKRNRYGDTELAKETLRQAIAFSEAMDSQRNIDKMKQFYTNIQQK